MTRFTDRIVLITGSGIGYEMARQFAAADSTVYAADRTPAQHGGSVTPVALDVTDEAATRATVASILDDTGHLDVVCNNAGIGSTTDPLNCSAAQWDQVFSVNARGAFLCTKCALEPMLAQDTGAIVNTPPRPVSSG